jgi:hypothetical protein
MNAIKTRIQGLNYNAIDQRFEAIVMFQELGDVVKFSCSLSFPIDARIEDVKRGLIAVAKTRRSSNLLNMSSRRPAAPRPSLLTKFTDIFRPHSIA